MKKLAGSFAFFLTINLLSFFMYLPIHNYTEFLFRQVLISIIMTAVFSSFEPPVHNLLKLYRHRRKQQL